jgi:hypothetical protein
MPTSSIKGVSLEREFGRVNPKAKKEIMESKDESKTKKKEELKQELQVVACLRLN